MNNLIKTDVCIIGAGPSDSATSIMLSKEKIHHYIIDKAVFPRDKTCGDGLILYAYKSLKTLGEEIFNGFLEHPKILHSNSIRLHINNDLNINFKESKDRDMVISYAKRIDFDNFLVEKISNDFAFKEFGNGVKSLEKTEKGILVTLKDNKQILAKIVVGADGVNSLVSRKLIKQKPDTKYKSTFISAYFKNVDDLPKDNEAEIRIVYKKIPLFFYIFPLSDGTVNVSLGARTDKLNKYNINLLEEVDHILNSHEKVKHKFKIASITSKWRGWVIPFHFGKQQVFGDNFLLVGDAAGLANAYYKEGVGTGMMSGILAVKTIKEAIRINDFSSKTLNKHQKNLKSEFGKLLKFSYFTLRLMRFKQIFYTIVSLFKKRVERKSEKMIIKRSY